MRTLSNLQLQKLAELYHASPTSGIGRLEPHVAKAHPTAAVYATPYKELALSMASPEASDDNIAINYYTDLSTNKKSNLHIDELKPGAFRRAYNRPAYLYKVPKEHFQTHPDLMAEEVISESPVETLEEEKIENILQYLLEAHKKGLINLNDYDSVLDSMKERTT